MLKLPSPKDIVEHICARFIDRKVIVNIFRAAHVEAMVGLALGEEYLLTDGWEGWDLSHSASGWRVEIKQSAARQVWHGAEVVPANPSFDIAARKGRFDGSKWIASEKPQRVAHAYVFAWHVDHKHDTCDQRDPAQWEFYVVPTSFLRIQQKTISLKRLRTLPNAVGPLRWRQLAAEIELVRAVWVRSGVEMP